MTDALIIDACRTPRGIGKQGKGALADMHPQHLAASVLKALAERNNLKTAEVDDIIWGTSTQRGKQVAGSTYVRGLAAIHACWPSAVSSAGSRPKRARKRSVVSRATVTVCLAQCWPHSISKAFLSLAGSPKPPRSIILMVPAGEAVDQQIAALRPLLDADDLIIDAGNALFHDTNRRSADAVAQGPHFMGIGVSGGSWTADAELAPSGAPLAELLVGTTPSCRNHTAFRSADGEFTCGVWDSTPYHRRAMRYGHFELMVLLRGAVTFVDERERTRTFRAGDVFLVEQGASCSWDSREEVAKIYAIYRPLA